VGLSVAPLVGHLPGLFLKHFYIRRQKPAENDPKRISAARTENVFNVAMGVLLIAVLDITVLFSNHDTSFWER
jgi:hypothetical protein